MKRRQVIWILITEQKFFSCYSCQKTTWACWMRCICWHRMWLRLRAKHWMHSKLGIMQSRVCNNFTSMSFRLISIRRLWKRRSIGTHSLRHFSYLMQVNCTLLQWFGFIFFTIILKCHFFPELVKQIEQNGKVTKINPTVAKELLNTPLKCHRCDANVKTMPYLKSHILKHLK